MLDFSFNLVYVFKNLLSVGISAGCLAVVTCSFFEVFRYLHRSVNLSIAKKELQTERTHLETANALLDRARVINELGQYQNKDDSHHEH